MACIERTLFGATDAATVAYTKLGRLAESGFRLSGNDKRIVLFGQMLTALGTLSDVVTLDRRFDLDRFE
jgi:hypothetical protein